MVYIIDDVCYAGELVEGIKVTQVKPLQGRMMIVTFSTGEKRLFDTTELQGSAFEILDNEDVFNRPEIFRGVITWDNGKVDIAPEMAYEKSYEYTAKETA